MEVAVRELTDRLSEYLKRAEAGEEIVVTSHGRAIARIVAAEPAHTGESGAIARLRAQPWVRAGDGKRIEPVPPRVRAAGPGEPLLSGLLLEDRQ
jgi:prevent-host-death family protein